MAAVRFYLQHSNFSPAQSKFILNAIHFLLTHNYFMFDGVFYLQTRGTAMGTSFALSDANLILGWWDSVHVFGDRNPYRHFITFYRRYIDDLIFIWNGDEHTLSLYCTLNIFIIMI
ncbi:hypothetical protein FKM82_024255 [Ascaphus truei]